MARSVTAIEQTGSGNLSSPRSKPSRSTGVQSHWFLLIWGAALQVLLLVVYSVSSRLSWYPSRLGEPSEWIDQHLYALASPLLPNAGSFSTIVPVAVYFAALAIMFGIYVLAIRQCWSRGAGTDASFYIVFAFSVVLSLSSLLQPFLSSQDIFSYAFYAHISALYGGNPYAAVPRDFPFDPLFSAIFWKDQPSNYGPLWTYLTAFVTLLTGPNTALTLLGIKLIVTGFALGTVPLVWAILGRMAPQMRLAGTLLYAWNPLVITETAGSGHNDSVVGFLVVLGFFLYLSNRRLGGIAALVLSVLTKYVTVVLLPLYLLLWLRECATMKQRLLVMVKVAGLAGILMATSFAPFSSGGLTPMQVASFGTNASAYVNSPLELALREIRVLLGDPRDVASLPLRYRGWWVTTSAPTELRPKMDDFDSPSIGLPASTMLMVVEPRLGAWLHVYAPRLDRFGYVPGDATAPTRAPTSLEAAGAATALAHVEEQGTNSQRANIILRAITGIIFLFVFLYRARATKTYSDVIYSSLVVLFASYWLIQTWFWPWYLNWALPLAALLPHRRIASLMVIFSLTTLGLHAQVTVTPFPSLEMFYEYRSLAIFGLPVLLLGIVLATPGLHRALTTFLRRASSWYKQMPTRGTEGKLRPSLLVNSDLDHVGTGSTRFPLKPGIVARSAVALMIVAVVGFTGIKAWAESKPQSTEATVTRPAVDGSDWAENYWMGVAYLEENRYSEAIASTTRAIEGKPDFIDAYRVRLEAFLQSGRLDNAIEDASTILAAEGDDVPLLLERAYAFQQTQRYRLALRDYGRVVEIAPSDPRAYRYRAQIYHEMGLENEAIASQQQALALSPYSAVLYRELAAMHAALGHMQAALILYDTAIALDKSDVESHVGRAAVLRILGRDEETIHDLREVLTLSDDEDLRSWASRTIAAVSTTNGPKSRTNLHEGP